MVPGIEAERRHTRDFSEPAVKCASDTSATPPVNEAKLGKVSQERLIERAVGSLERILDGQAVKVEFTDGLP
jgi:hypothetical protein